MRRLPSRAPGRQRRRAPITLLGVSGCALSLSCQALNDPGEFVIFGLTPDASVEPPIEPPAPPPDQPRECRSEPPERRCNAGVPEQCSEAGEWEAAGAACQLGCRGGACLECAPGATQCSSRGVPQLCTSEGRWRDEAACAAGQTCVAGTGTCGECAEGDKRFCAGALGNCSRGEQTCQADATWGPCSIQPADDTCTPGDDGNCDGLPNTPATGACACSEDVSCGPSTDTGECAFGVSACTNGVLGPCTGAVAPQARDCRSPLDHDCDGKPDDASCECPAGSARACGPGPCAGQQTCLLSADASSTSWGPCVAPELGEFQAPELITGLSASGDLWGPALSADGLTLVFGAGFPENIFSATRTERGGAFSPATALAAVNTEGNEGTPFLSADGLTLYFYAIEPTGPDDRNLKLARRPALADGFGAPALLANLDTAADEQNPWVSADELRLVFDSNRPGGDGGQDLWLARRASRAANFEAPANLEALNTSASEEGAALSNDELVIFFASNRSGGQGSLDIWLASRGDDQSDFSAPENLGVVNSSGQDLDPALSADGTELFFSSSRAGAQQLYRSVRSCN